MFGDIDLSSLLDWEDGLPHPRWDLVAQWVESREPGQQPAARDAVTRRWLSALGAELGRGYETAETDHFLTLSHRSGPGGVALLRFAERCRSGLTHALGDVADFDGAGRQVALVFRDQADYYRYVSRYFGEGEHGGSAGVHVREGFPHVALYGRQADLCENTLAHELTHVALHHLTMPQWLEEGLAQMMEHDTTGRSLLLVDAEMAGRHKRYWGKHGLDDFWRGEGFSRPGKVQELSYQLAEILVRLLAEDGRPRWFGWVREPRRKFFAFLRAADAADCGEAACRDHLGHGIDALAARFLGPGEWSPSL